MKDCLHVPSASVAETRRVAIAAASLRRRFCRDRASCHVEWLSGDTSWTFAAGPPSQCTIGAIFSRQVFRMPYSLVALASLSSPCLGRAVAAR